MSESLRPRDMAVEQEVARFLDEHLYPRICTSFERFTGKADQLKGKDVRFAIDGIGDIIVDEKAASHYINKNLRTFAFEIGFMRGDSHTPGWFIDDKETEFYLCVWIEAKKDWELAAEDITSLDCMLISRRALLAYLTSARVNVEEMLLFEKSARENDIVGAQLKEEYADKKFYFFLTGDFPEKPFNVLFRKEILAILAIRRWEVSPGRVVQLKPLPEKTVRS